MTKETPFIIEMNHLECMIHERNGSSKRVEFSPGEVSTAQIKAIAYSLLAMAGE